MTGGRLRFGLSAAGRLDAEIFRFFEAHGVVSDERLRDDRGDRRDHDDPARPLQGRLARSRAPGIELSVGADGELAVRGPYVMIGHVETPAKAKRRSNAEGWLENGRSRGARRRTATSASSTARRRSTRTSRGDDRAGPDRVVLSRFRLGGPRLPRRGSPRVQHRSHLAEPRRARPRLRCDGRRREEGALPIDRLVRQRLSRALRADRRLRAHRPRSRGRPGRADARRARPAGRSSHRISPRRSACCTGGRTSRSAASRSSSRTGSSRRWA